MKNKVVLIFTSLMFLSQISINAATIYTSSGTVLENGNAICANDYYYYETDSNDMYEAEVIDASNLMLLTTFNAKNGTIEFIFPENIENLLVYVYDYKENKRTLTDKFEFKVSNCEYEVTTEDYSSSGPQTKISKSESGITFTEPNVENYHLYINQLEAEDDGRSVEIKFNDGVATEQVESDILQVIEEYSDADGKKKTKYYEIDLENDIIIRNLSNLELSIIEPMQYIDMDLLVRVLAGFIVLVILYLINTILVKKYRAKRAYYKRLAKFKNQQREKLIAKRKQEEQVKKEKQAEIYRAQVERDRRSNLEIRK